LKCRRTFGVLFLNSFVTSFGDCSLNCICNCFTYFDNIGLIDKKIDKKVDADREREREKDCLCATKFNFNKIDILTYVEKRSFLIEAND